MESDGTMSQCKLYQNSPCHCPNDTISHRHNASYTRTLPVTFIASQAGGFLTRSQCKLYQNSPCHRTPTSSPLSGRGSQCKLYQNSPCHLELLECVVTMQVIPELSLSLGGFPLTYCRHLVTMQVIPELSLSQICTSCCSSVTMQVIPELSLSLFGNRTLSAPSTCHNASYTRTLPVTLRENRSIPIPPARQSLFS
jgi:hypothetical protein